MELNVKEIFFSYQAEGYYIGTPMVFVRFSGCNLRCYYCDTRYALHVRKKDSIKISEVVSKVLNLAKKYKTNFISLTGGEPLLQKSLFFLINELKLRNKQIKIYLETNATLFLRFKEIVNYIDICALNLKIPIDDKDNRSFIKDTEKIVKLCKLKNKKHFIKLLVSKNPYDKKTLNTLKSFFKNTKPKLVILQPETKALLSNNKELFFNLSNIYNEIKSIVPHIHIIPQLHKFIWRIK